MLKTRKRWISLLVTLAMLVTFVVPFAGPAAAATSGYEALQVPNVDTDSVDSLGTVLGQVRAGALKIGDIISLRLPSDFQFLAGDQKDEVMKDSDWKVVASDSVASGNFIEVPVNYEGNVNLIKPDDLTVEMLDDNEIKITLNSVSNATYGEGVYFLLHMGNIYIPSDADGDVTLTASGPSSTGFPRGSVVVARVGGGDVNISVIDQPTFSDDTDKTTDPVTIRLEEDLKGSLKADDESLKFTLPSGFTWQDVTASDVSVLWGEWNNRADKEPIVTFDKNDVGKKDAAGKYVADLVIYTDDDELIVAVNNESSKAACLELTLGINVEDENKAKKGDVKVKISGESDTNVSEAVVGTYGEYGAEIKVDGDPPTVFAGQTEQAIADLKITEDVEGSLVDGRSITLTLPDNAKWGKIDDGDSDSNVSIDFDSFIGNDGREIKYTVDGESTDAAELSLEDMEIVVEPGTEGDITITVGGTAGLSGELVVAKAVTPVSITAAAKKDVKIGLKGQEAGDLTITENAAGAINDDKDMVIDLPDGVKFETVPDVKVTNGDLDIDESGIKRQNDDNQLVIPIDGKSTEASTIAISGIKYTVDRTVAEGDITVKVQGPAVNQVNDYDEIKDYFGENYIDDDDWVYVGGTSDEYKAFRLKTDDSGNLMIWPQSKTAASAVNAVVVTPAPVDQKGTAVFKIGEKKYTVNGQEFEMDVAPIAEAGRTYLPARYVANAMGVPDANILWDQASKTVTVIRGERFVQMKVGSKQILVNGITLNMDVAPKVVPGRVLIPFRFLAQALGAEVVWDPADPNTIILNF